MFAPQVEGPGLLLAHDPAEAAAEIGAHSERDAGRYAEYRAFLAETRGFATRVLDAAPPDPPFTIVATSTHIVWASIWNAAYDWNSGSVTSLALSP